MNRRETLMAAGAAAAAGRLAVAAPAERPNILWIMTDQQVADGMSCTGNPDLHTPAMDSLAARGLRFELAYCANPICVPSRTAMMTGRMPHEVGVNCNLNHFQLYAPSLGRVMTQAGYDTGYIGKWHIPEPWDASDWHGFRTMDGRSNPEHNDRHFAEPIARFLEKKRSQPFFLVASFVNPHDICEYARKLAGFPPEKSTLWNGPVPEAPPPDRCPELPANFEIPENEPDIIREHQRWLSGGAYPSIGWPEDTWRQYRWALNRLIERVDSEIAKVLETLRRTGLDRNTVVLFTSDHGDGNAAHRWNQKTLLYEETARVPLILSAPGMAAPGSVDREHLVQTGTDLFRTVCDYAGAREPAGLRGLSLRPLAEGRRPAWRDDLVTECNLHRQYGLQSEVNGRMLRTRNFKYAVYSRGKIREQLTDMRSDPGEMKNLAADPAYADVLQDHRRRLARHIRETNDFFIVPDLEDNGWTLKPHQETP